jgi:membrane associated rhomboid family serine protease
MIFLWAFGPEVEDLMGRGRYLTLLVILVFVRVTYVPAVLLIGLWGLTQFLSLGAISQNPSAGGVAYAAHVAGFIFGAVAARLFAGAETCRQDQTAANISLGRRRASAPSGPARG